MPKLSQLPPDGSPSSNDYLGGVQQSGQTTKSFSLSALLTWFFANVPVGSILPVSLLAGTGSSWAWQSWTPTLTNLTLGNGTVTAKYIQIGKTVFYRFVFTLGSTSAVGTSPTFTLPTTPISVGATASGSIPVGVARFEDNTLTSFEGQVFVTAATPTSSASIVVFNAAGTYLGSSTVTPTVPFTFGTGDELRAFGHYETA